MRDLNLEEIKNVSGGSANPVGASHGDGGGDISPGVLRLIASAETRGQPISSIVSDE